MLWSYVYNNLVYRYFVLVDFVRGKIESCGYRDQRSQEKNIKREYKSLRDILHWIYTFACS